MTVSAVAMTTALGGAAAAQEITSAERTIESTELAPGETTEVTVTVEASGSGDIVVVENYSAPLGDIAVTGADPFPVTQSTRNNSEAVAVWSGESSVSLTYEVTVPENASDGDTFTVNSTVSIDGGENANVTGPDTITVSRIEAERSVGSTELAPGESTNVTVQTNASTAGNISLAEDFSPGFSGVSITGATPPTSSEDVRNGNGGVEADWQDTDNASLTYEVTVPDDATTGNTFNISGTASLDGGSGVRVSGPDTISVVGVEAERTIESTTVAPGESTNVTVETNASGAGNVTVLEEFSPAFAEVTVSAMGTNPFPTTQTVQGDNSSLVAVWRGTASATLTYEVTVPDDAANGTTFAVDGNASVDGGDSVSVTGAGTITVQEQQSVVDPYRNENGIVGVDGLRQALSDWSNGQLAVAELQEVLNAWSSGT